MQERLPEGSALPTRAFTTGQREAVPSGVDPAKATESAGRHQPGEVPFRPEEVPVRQAEVPFLQAGRQQQDRRQEEAPSRHHTEDRPQRFLPVPQRHPPITGEISGHMTATAHQVTAEVPLHQEVTAEAVRTAVQVTAAAVPLHQVVTAAVLHPEVTAEVLPADTEDKHINELQDNKILI